MEEADKLCDRIGIIDHGKIQAVDKPSIMKNALGNDRISFTLVDGIDKRDSLIKKIEEIDFVKEIKLKEDEITVFSSQSTDVIPRIFQISNDMKMKINTISLAQPTLDDVFISYTGHNLRDDNSQKFSRRKEFNLNRRRGF